ncbi:MULTISPECIES: hypothetical protein [Oceanibaculum]|uniref:Uncharacterized protein n=1 Tax=Oceanibaculum indicum TaxID=526216 RepID=A0A420WQE7_9PROT|nr:MULTISPECIES: hypothetical protein [Oceanibaculum]MCH2395493.1 hypothetical protein [Oceanibaculum sp.]RKQ73267.1 hypothetical protein BCL74_1053 [Oceanibaculum indicum]
MSRKNIFFKRPPKRRFGLAVAAAVLVAGGLSWSLYDGYYASGLPRCDSELVRQEIGRALAAEWSARNSTPEVVSFRENRRRVAGDMIEARECAARTLQGGGVGIVRYSVLRHSEGSGFRIDIMGQEAQQNASR